MRLTGPDQPLERWVLPLNVWILTVQPMRVLSHKVAWGPVLHVWSIYLVKKKIQKALLMPLLPLLPISEGEAFSLINKKKKGKKKKEYKCV